MTAQEITAHDVVTFGDLKMLAGASSPCITITVPIPTPFGISTRLKNAVRSVEKQLAARAQPATIASLLEPIYELTRSAETAGIWSNGLIVFRSPDAFRYFSLSGRVPESERVEERFQVRPLLAALTREQRFHLLALSRQRIRLWHCTQHRVQEASMQGTVPQDMRAWLNTRQPDHLLKNRSTIGPSTGAMKGVSFGTNADRDREDEYVAHFFKEIDKGVNLLLRNDRAPLVLVGVDSELAAYRRVNTYPRLLEKEVHASADGLSDRELHTRAMEAILEVRSEMLESALSDFQKYRGAGRVTFDGGEAVKAAWEGRVADFFFSQAAEARGTWNEARSESEAGSHSEDLLNAAALQTVLHGGRAFMLEGSDHVMPGDIAAVLRF